MCPWWQHTHALTGVVSAGDLEKIVNLLLSLSSRLSRIDRSLLSLEGEELTREGAAEERVRLKVHTRQIPHGKLPPRGHLRPGSLNTLSFLFILH